MHGDALRFAVGLFCLLLGALVLVAPHKLAGQNFVVVRPMAPVLGVLLISGGMMLVGTNLLSVSRALFVAAHLIAAVPIGIFGVAYLAAANWHAAVLALGAAVWTVVAATVPPHAGPIDRRSPYLLSVMLGTISLAFGATLIVERLVGASLPEGPAPTGWYGPIFALSGLSVVVAETSRLRGTRAATVARIGLGLVFVGHAAIVALPAQAIVGALYLGLFGCSLIVLPWMSHRRLADGASLQAQLAVALLGITIAVITTMIAVLGAREERSTVAAQLDVNQALAEALSANVTEYVLLHQQALTALVNTPGLARMAPAEQGALLRSLSSAYPDVVAFATSSPSRRSAPTATPSPVATVGRSWTPPVTGCCRQRPGHRSPSARAFRR
jgi:hypothetical protein